MGLYENSASPTNRAMPNNKIPTTSWRNFWKNRLIPSIYVYWREDGRPVLQAFTLVGALPETPMALDFGQLKRQSKAAYETPYGQWLTPY